MIRENYQDLFLSCKVIAACLETIVEIKEYKEYGWANIAFMTDHFGGVYAIFHYDYGTMELRKDYGKEEELDIDRIKTLYDIVKEENEKAMKARDFEALSEFINDQYD